MTIGRCAFTLPPVRDAASTLAATPRHPGVGPNHTLSNNQEIRVVRSIKQAGVNRPSCVLLIERETRLNRRVQRVKSFRSNRHNSTVVLTFRVSPTTPCGVSRRRKWRGGATETQPEWEWGGQWGTEVGVPSEMGRRPMTGRQVASCSSLWR